MNRTMNHADAVRSNFTPLRVTHFMCRAPLLTAYPTTDDGRLFSSPPRRQVSPRLAKVFIGFPFHVSRLVVGRRFNHREGKANWSASLGVFYDVGMDTEDFSEQGRRE